MNKNPRPARQANSEIPDDISALGEAFSLGAFHYIDIAREERLAAIDARWPLLAELSALQIKES